ncbi:Type I restriction-modification system, specificity subunit S [Vibrio fluvialis PG41]|uniref:Type I restriction-modification system, specificity subunit S n=1 Tax=Vibrio fluvialis PG41 TaxID=1336752 RepID=S7I0X0_VIBFL|nr:restriction endonuclease subunit S [Vibrio fluvialis]EPP21618.1 Type I restriction-modification system, specificity subunit S [Vibrio fluvialis PG41]
MIGYKINDSFGQIGSGTTPKSNDDSYYADNGIPWLNSGDLTNKEVKFIKKKITDKALSEVFSGNVYHEKSLAIAMYGATIGKTGIVNGGFVSNQACCILSKPLGVNLNYVQYVINSSLDKLLLESQGGGQQNINQDIIKNFRFFAPEKSEQEDIARYLDKKIVLIDNKIDHLTQKLHHLEEYKTALIHNAVTTGLDANGEQIIENARWTSSKFKSIASYQKGIKPKSLQDNKTQNNLPYLNMQQLRGNSAPLEFADSFDGVLVKDGDLIILWDGANAGELIKGKNGLLSSTMALIKSNNLDSDFLYYSLQSSESELRDKYVGMGIPHVSSEILNSLLINHPISVEHQVMISDFIKIKENHISKLKGNINKKIALLIEYKKSLINEAVSGKQKE